MKRIMVNYDKCNGCLTCTLACAGAHSESGTITGAMLEGIKPRLWVESANLRPVPVLCRHCEEPVCVEACMTGAMKKDPVQGVVSNEGNEQTCVGCWMCVMVCPYGAIVQSEGMGGLSRVALKCDLCRHLDEPACVASCPNGALEFVEADDFAGKKRSET
ncbi:MAG: 4Fe-4S dicluster domain-containing protein, partial [Bacillota bacterium]